MFWTKKKSKKTSNPETPEEYQKRIREQALANANAARENLGQETIDKIAAQMTKMQKSNMAKARAQLDEVDPDKMLDELKYMLDDRD